MVPDVKYATLSKSVFAVTAVLIATACANSAEVPAEDTSPTEPAPPAETKLPAATPASTPPPAPKACTADTDCSGTCATGAAGVSCCDSGSKKCLCKSGTACQAPPADPPADPPPSY